MNENVNYCQLLFGDMFSLLEGRTEKSDDVVIIS